MPKSFSFVRSVVESTLPFKRTLYALYIGLSLSSCASLPLPVLFDFNARFEVCSNMSFLSCAASCSIHSMSTFSDTLIAIFFDSHEWATGKLLDSSLSPTQPCWPSITSVQSLRAVVIRVVAVSLV